MQHWANISISMMETYCKKYLIFNYWAGKPEAPPRYGSCVSPCGSCGSCILLANVWSVGFVSCCHFTMQEKSHKQVLCNVITTQKLYKISLFEHFFEVGVPIGRNLQKSVRKNTVSVGKPRKSSPFLRSFWEYFCGVFSMCFSMLSRRGFFPTFVPNGVPNECF